MVAQALRSCRACRPFSPSCSDHFYTIDRNHREHDAARSRPTIFMAIGTMLERAEQRLAAARRQVSLPAAAAGRCRRPGRHPPMGRGAAQRVGARGLPQGLWQRDSGEPGGRNPALRSVPFRARCASASSGSRKRSGGYRYGKRNPRLNSRLRGTAGDAARGLRGPHDHGRPARIPARRRSGMCTIGGRRIQSVHGARVSSTIDAATD